MCKYYAYVLLMDISCMKFDLNKSLCDTTLKFSIH